MNIKHLVIENFKSIERIELENPNPFTVFVGPNGSGKSNIFEALEFERRFWKTPPFDALREFGGMKNIQNRNRTDLDSFFYEFKLEPDSHFIRTILNYKEEKFSGGWNEINGLDGERKLSDRINYDNSQFNKRFSRIFVGNTKPTRVYYQDDSLLNFAATNLEPVLKRILQNPVLRDEIFEWLDLFVPGFKAVEIDDRNELHWFEDHGVDYFTKDLISDGTYNILALLTAVYQSDDKPQFLCIEEPENGLHPQVAKELVDFFRIMCEERGHYIWLNTHSQSMVSRLTADEMIVVEKKQGATQTTQYKGRDFHGLRMDEALMMNVLGAGLAW